MDTTQIRASLESLGDTPDAVASAMAAAGIIGRPRCWDDDPVCKWLKWRFGLPFVERARACIAVRVGDNFEILDMPAAVVAFWERFNLSEYPDLIDPPRMPPQGPQGETNVAK